MWIAEMMALPVFALAFVQYIQYFVEISFWQEILIKVLFLSGLLFVNILGVKKAGRINDVLTIVKITPLLMLIVYGLYFFAINPTILGNYSPIAPMGFDNFGIALVLIFWAYVGFEMGTLPAAEVKNPSKTIPKAIIVGIFIVLAFYLLTNFVIFGVVNWTDLSKTKVPLVLASTMMIGAVGGLIIGIGAIVSVSGSNESGMLGVARLSYAMSIKGLFPKIFSKVHPKYKTPHMALIIQGIIAFFLSIFGGIRELISFSVFNLAFSFLLVCLSLIILKKGSEHKLHGQHILPFIGIAICIFLLYSTSMWDKIIGATIILLGIPIYVFLSPKTDFHHLKELFLSEEAIFTRALEKKEHFLGNFVGLCHKLYKSIKR